MGVLFIDSIKTQLMEAILTNNHGNINDRTNSKTNGEITRKTGMK
jgi:hypothetical protein